jgi:hypothetical protein
MLATAVRQPSQSQQQPDQSTSCKQVTVLQRACEGRQESPAVFPASTLATALGQPSQPQQLPEQLSSCLQVTVLQRASEGRQETPAGVVPIAGVSSALNNMDAEVVDKFDNPLHSHSCFRNTRGDDHRVFSQISESTAAPKKNRKKKDAMKAKEPSEPTAALPEGHQRATHGGRPTTNGQEEEVGETRGNVSPRSTDSPSTPHPSAPLPPQGPRPQRSIDAYHATQFLAQKTVEAVYKEKVRHYGEHCTRWTCPNESVYKFLARRVSNFPWPHPVRMSVVWTEEKLGAAEADEGAEGRTERLEDRSCACRRCETVL